MLTQLENTVAVLTRTPAVLSTLLRDLADGWTATNEGDGTWSAFDIVGHLIQGERANWLPRARMILESGETRAFAPFDRRPQEHDTQGKSLNDLLEEFAGLRRQNLAELRSLDLKPADLDRRGRHPSVGVVTLSQLLSTWAAHDLNHLHQLSRVMAHQYRDAVGPWQLYLGVMHCDGHGAP